jgi:hypothetical protein
VVVGLFEVEVEEVDVRAVTGSAQFRSAMPRPTMMGGTIKYIGIISATAGDIWRWLGLIF